MRVRVKQDRSRRSGHKHSLNIQDHWPYAWTPDEDRRHLRTLALDLVHGLKQRGNVIVTVEQQKAANVAIAAAKNLVEALG